MIFYLYDFGQSVVNEVGHRTVLWAQKFLLGDWASGLQILSTRKKHIF